MATTIIMEQCEVAPSSGAPTEQLLKLAHLDILFLQSPPMKSMFFYSFQCSESHFLDTIVPNLKRSLSLTLKHFLPMAGKIVIPIASDTSSMPFSKYVAGQDYFPLTIAVSNADFLKLTEKHSSRDDDGHQFHDLIPPLASPAVSDTSTVEIPVAAFQVTLFPNKGVCIGHAGSHAIADGATRVHFIQTWASINRFNGDDSHLGHKSLPFYKRDHVVKDGDRLAMESWSYIKKILSSVPVFSSPLHQSRATFVLSESRIQKLKSLVPDAVRVSSFTVACAFLWTCLARSAGEEVADDEPEYFCFGADCRGRLDPPLPDTYFGNCSIFVIAESTNGKLRGSEGFLAAAEAIREAVEKALGGGEKGIMDGSIKSFQEFVGGLGKRMHLVAGSTRFDMYATIDYGWGRPIKFDRPQGRVGVSFFSKSGESQGGIEFVVSMTKVKMDAFAAFFNQGVVATDKLLWCKM